MTEKDKMLAGELYDPTDEEIQREQAVWNAKLYEFNQLRPDQVDEMRAYMKEVFAECGEHNYIQLPFYANWGGHHVHFGSHIYANFNFTCTDDGHIYIGDWSQFGPNVTIATAGHPTEPELRKDPMLQYNKDVHIGSNVWVGAGALILPGVTIGDNTVIGAGSVVTRDIPANVVAYGNPCRVARELK
jgi:galactoside O-acetyltransferase